MLKKYFKKGFKKYTFNAEQRIKKMIMERYLKYNFKYYSEITGLNK